MRKFLACFACLLAISAVSCKTYHKNKSHAGISDERISKGEALAAQYCRGCHVLPDPSLLNAASWEAGVLPNMGPRLGIFQHNFQRYPSSINDPALDSNFYPAKPLLTSDEWQSIIDYYVSVSPDSLPGQSRKQVIKKGLPLFETQFPAYSYDSAAISFIKIDESTPQHQLILYDVIRQKILRFKSSLELADSMKVSAGIVDMEFHNDKIVACDIGRLNPTNGKYGRGLFFSRDTSQRLIRDSLPFFDGLARPVQITRADINADGKMDYVICEFGNLTGSLSWMESTGKDKYLRHMLKPLPGAIRVYVTDYNKDGLPDLWVLFAQGKESIELLPTGATGSSISANC